MQPPTPKASPATMRPPAGQTAAAGTEAQRFPFPPGLSSTYLVAQQLLHLPAANEPLSASSRKRRGNAFVEMAFTIIPLFALLFGIIDFGFGIFLKNTFQHAVREGVRYAVTYQTMNGMGHDASIKKVVQNSAMGFLSGSSGLSKIYIRYYVPGTFALTSLNSPGNLVEVSVEGYQWGWVAPLLRRATPLTISARSSDRMEGLPLGTLSPPAR